VFLVFFPVARDGQDKCAIFLTINERSSFLTCLFVISGLFGWLLFFLVGDELCYISLHCKFQWRRIVIFWNFDRRSCKPAGRSQVNETANLNLNDWTLFGLNIRRFEALLVSFLSRWILIIF